MNKEELRPLYSELQGYLAQAPNSDKAICDESIWKQYNDSVKLISKISREDFNRFLILNIEENVAGKFIRPILYRQKLGGLISFLHGKYFNDEPTPFSAGPSTIISQQQNQSVHVQMLLEIQSKIDERIHSLPEGSKEKSFLQKFKNKLSSISNVTQFISQLIKMAKEFGLNIDDISKIFN
ncbi:MAG: hypothetical protein HYV59_16080 [Planctomycetes bacterium]|nr:hypothetical protein [Planctomycetota bacterium]